MADFQTAIKKTLPHEGYYVNDPTDRGGETYAGISRIHNPSWPGWAVIDAAKPLKWNQRVPAADPFVEVYYERHYWPVIQGDKINDQRVAGFLFDFYVNSGTRAIRAVQGILNLIADGIAGPKTISAINSANPETLFKELQGSRITFVHDIVRNRQSQKKFLAGWLRRILSFQ